ncbi:DedA family protein [Acaricomes phytoseiuli]|uniref:DedA family protein n=1 Tax=Acaricomes phytoseiuli TaxID=291968 RepID=UPI0003761E0B|nr:VTT domain-containing protein [Acaricomes phytoseiuli]
MDYFLSLPFGLAVAALFVIVMLRANATYWAGRGAVAGGRRTRMRRYLDSPGMARAEELVARWGAIAVSLCFLTVGLQTAINFSAGATRMPYPSRYLPAVVVGSVLWALLYATVGLAFFTAAIDMIGGEPGVMLAPLGLVVVITVTLLFRRRMTQRANDSERKH